MLGLPSDILLLICEELGNRQEFGSLLNCALSGRTLSGSALLWLYRIHGQSSVTTGEGNDADFASASGLSMQARSAEQKKTVSKWALQWNSIIRSSLDQTAYPYCLYIRSLDLRNLADLLADPLFREVALDKFFAGDMARFLAVQSTPSKKQTRGRRQNIDIPVILDLVGESITSFVSESASRNHATVALEDLAGEISSTALPVWTSRLSRLKGLTLWDGSSLDAKVAMAITKNCFGFDDLTFFTCVPSKKTYDEIDHDMAMFFSSLRANTLRSFSALSARAVGSETLLALNHHAKSLKLLKLSGLASTSIRKLSLLKECTAIETLVIEDGEGLVNLELTENDVFLDVIAWLGSCKQLKDIHISNLISGPAILTKLCLNNDIRLRELDVNDYSVLGNATFHAAIAHQTSLESLKLKGDPEDAFRDEIDILVTAIRQLKQLKYLNIVSTSENFGTSDILRLLSSLRNLEELWFSGYDANDDIWHFLAMLPNLRSLNVHAVSSFSFDSILAFISVLKPSNHGLLLSVMAQNPENALSDHEQAMIRDSIAAKVNGQFDYVLYRDADSASESFSD